MKKVLFTLLFCAGMLAATSASAADTDSVKTAKVQDMRRVLINRYHLTEAQAIQLTPAVATYVATVGFDKSLAEQSFNLAFQRVVGKPFAGN